MALVDLALELIPAAIDDVEVVVVEVTPVLLLLLNLAFDLFPAFPAFPLGEVLGRRRARKSPCPGDAQWTEA
jgi:hypothetical protein